MPRRTTNSNEALYAFDTARRAEHGTVCGVDEAGRGPLCGPVCCAAVILNPDDPIEGVNDSKKLTEKRRDALYEEITKRALAYKIIFISPQEIDERNILWATMDGMAQAVAGLEITPDYVLIDGNRCPPGLIQPAEAVVKGDANSASIEMCIRDRPIPMAATGSPAAICWWAPAICCPCPAWTARILPRVCCILAGNRVQ